eukprot:3541316-Amphidinium_carterae.1
MLGKCVFFGSVDEGPGGHTPEGLENIWGGGCGTMPVSLPLQTLGRRQGDGYGKASIEAYAGLHHKSSPLSL